MDADRPTGGPDTFDEQQLRAATITNWRHFKRRKRRRKLEKERDVELLQSRLLSTPLPPGRRATFVLLAFIFISILLLGARQTMAESDGQVASANEIIQTAEAQPLVFNLLREFGSGDGAFGNGKQARRTSNSGQQLDFSLSSSPVSPSLIEARCWNNYEDDNNCKQLNVITAPNADELLRQKQQQQQQQFGSSDNIITPIVIFESSSTPAERQFAGQPPYLTGGGRAGEPIANDKFAATPQTATILPVHFERPVTRPSAKNSVIYVATPQSADRQLKQPSSSSNSNRPCRDENDADCDEPEEAEGNDKTGTNSGANDPDDDEETGTSRPYGSAMDDISSSTGSNVATGEFGSGNYGTPADDNDDSTDDADEESGQPAEGDEMNESSGNSSPGLIDGLPASSTPKGLLEVTTVYVEGGVASSGEPSAQSSTTVSTTSRQTGAEIEVVVHSTLPPSFPLATSYESGLSSPPSQSSNFAQSTTTTTTTMPPDETFTSRPIFPPSSEKGAGGDAPVDSENDGLGGQEAAANITPEIDLYTFKPIPIPVEAPGGRQQQNGYDQTADKQQSQSQAQQQSGQPQHELSSQHIHEPSAANRRPYENRNSFDDGWTTRRPFATHSQQASGREQQQQADAFAIANSNKRLNSLKTHIGTDMLPTLLLYASIIVLVTTALIFVIMFYVFWRRNTIRRRELLQKAHLLSVPQQPPPGGHLIQSMSHASQLQGGGSGPAGAGGHRQPGLLSTYAPGKGLTMGKVTTSLAKSTGDEARMLGNTHEDAEDEEDEEGEDQEMFGQKSSTKDQPNATAPAGDDLRQARSRAPRLDTTSGHPNQSSWSTEEPTTSSGGGGGGGGGTSSSQTQDNLPPVGSAPAGTTNGASNQNGHLPNGRNSAPRYPNSLSDGRQNSSSISDSQCSPDGASLDPSIMNHINPTHQNQIGPPPPSSGHMMRPPMGGPYVGPQPPQGGHMAPPLRHPSYSNGVMTAGSSQHRHPYGPAMMAPSMMAPIQMNGHSPKRRFMSASRSIEELQLSASSSHVGFVDQQTHHQMPYAPQHHLSQLIQTRPLFATGPNQSPINPSLGGYPSAAPSPSISLQSAAFSQQHQQLLINPQRIAMNPLATLGRRYPPGTGLNRNIYSEDSSSFMTTSPSLARTSSSSSFALNLAKHQPSESPPSMGSINSVKAKPLVDPASGRMINNFMGQTEFHVTTNSGNNGHHQTHTTNGATPNGQQPPPIFGRRDRSEAWYV